MKKLLAAILTAILMMSCLTAFAASNVYFTGDANVRTGPGLGYSMIGMVNGGSTMPYQQQKAFDSRGVCWYKILFNGSDGWVSSSYAQLTDVAGSATFSAGGGNATNGFFGFDSFGFYSGTVEVNGDTNVRSGPGLGYSILDTIFVGETAIYLGNTSTDDRGVMWYNVQFEEHTGWVSSVYATLTGDSVTGSYVKGTSGDSNVRKGPGLGNSSFGYLYEGETAPFLGKTSVDERGVLWYNISYDGASGWVSSMYTTLAG